MKVIGLTGGIGSGKSTIAAMFQKRGAWVIDADKIGHRLLKEPEVISKIRDLFGGESIDPKTGEIDRKRLGTQVFKDINLLKKLEAYLHPKILDEINHQVRLAKKEKAPLVLIEAALWIESGFYKLYDGVFLIASTEDQQIERVQKRDALSAEQIESRIRVQLAFSEKLKFATEVIDNSKGLEQTEAEVDRLYKKWSKF